MRTCSAALAASRQAVVPHRPPQQDEQEREHQVELEEDDQEVELVVPGPHQIGQVIEPSPATIPWSRAG